jgi:Zn-dependent peptidase ImmA (M78 family)
MRGGMQGMTQERIDEIEDKAQALLREKNVDASNGFDIVELAQKMGFVVGNVALDENEDGFIIVNENDKTLLGTSSNKVIAVNARLDYHFKRFIIAHELGHYILEGGNKNQLYAHRNNKTEERNDKEQEVDRFAASLLMPRDVFRSKLESIHKYEQSLPKCVHMLKNIFKAPLECVLRRIQELGLLHIFEANINEL